MYNSIKLPFRAGFNYMLLLGELLHKHFSTL